VKRRAARMAVKAAAVKRYTQKGRVPAGFLPSGKGREAPVEE
jgi:hypothetical protein